MAKKEDKTNVMRILEQKKIPYVPHTYPHGDEAVDGATVAALLNQRPEQVFKTLVTRTAGNDFCVFVIPVEAELDLKKAARCAGEKSVSMLHVAELLPLTGYVRGGCSPVGMKKQFRTFFHESALQEETICVSGGRIGVQVEVQPEALAKLIRGRFGDLIR